jgi:hypothetical protein
MNNSQNSFAVPLLVTIVALLLIGGGVYIYNNRKADVPVLIDNAINLNSVECKKYTNLITAKIDQYNALQKPEFKNSDNTGENPQFDLYINNNILKEVFYTPKINSCLYLESRRILVKPGTDAKPDVGSWSVAYETYYLIDALTYEEISFYQGMPFMQMINRGLQFHSEKEADDVLSEYR